MASFSTKTGSLFRNANRGVCRVKSYPRIWFCKSHIRRYNPPASSRSWCCPRSMTLPWRSTRISSIFSSPTSRCVISKILCSPSSSIILFMICRSSRASRLAVGSSSTSKGARRSKARAMAIRWRSPPLKRKPLLAYPGLKTIRQRLDEIIDLRLAGSPHQVFIAGSGLCDQQILADRGIEQVRVLLYHRHLAADILGGIVADIPPTPG
jgi:hypothetical protein